MDLNDLVDGRERLNDAGDAGWELIAITVNRIAFLKRPTEVDPAYGLRKIIPTAVAACQGHANAQGSDVKVDMMLTLSRFGGSR